MQTVQEIQEEIDRLYRLTQTTLSGRYANITRINDLNAQLEVIKSNENKVREFWGNFTLKKIVSSMIYNGYTLDEFMQYHNLQCSSEERTIIQSLYDSTEAMSPNQVFDVAHHMFVTGTKLENDILVWGYTATKLDRKNVITKYNQIVLDNISDLLVSQYSQETQMKRVQTLAAKFILEEK